MGLRREEQKLITDIKKAAKQNNTQATRVLAKSLVRLRGQMNQLRASEAHLRGVKTTITVNAQTVSQDRLNATRDRLNATKTARSACMCNRCSKAVQIYLAMQIVSRLLGVSISQQSFFKTQILAF